MHCRPELYIGYVSLLLDRLTKQYSGSEGVAAAVQTVRSGITDWDESRAVQPAKVSCSGVSHSILYYLWLSTESCR
jgi:hypothetical protein